jgi:hypothetical protein
VSLYLGAHGDESHEQHEYERDGDEEYVDLAGQAGRVPDVHEDDPEDGAHVGADRNHQDLHVADEPPHRQCCCCTQRHERGGHMMMK